MFDLIVAVSENTESHKFGIGYANDIPWKCSEDMQHFKATTINNIVVFGKNTFKSLNYQPLKNRINVIISKSLFESKVVNEPIVNEPTADFNELKAIVNEPIVNVNEPTADINELNRDNPYYVLREKINDFAQKMRTLSDELKDLEKRILINDSKIKKYNEVLFGEPRTVDFSTDLKNADVKLTPVIIYPSVAAFVEDYVSANIKYKVFVCGGSNIYKEFIEKSLISNYIITIVAPNIQCDTFITLPNALLMNNRLKIVTDALTKVEQLNESESITIFKYMIKNQEEQTFLHLMKDILTNGVSKIDRTNTGTKSLFGKTLSFDLSNNTFPLLTTRKMFLRGIFEELMLYIRGQTNSKILEDKKINAWVKNTSREFLDKCNLQHLPVGDMGASYGFLFRHFSAKYIDCNTNYTGQGFDQLENVINTIKTNPTSRRIIISLWDPSNLDNCPLPPCLYNYQFSVDVELKTLSCMQTQRSSDFAIAGGWNIATGALLTILIAAATSLTPGKLIWNIGDVHVYNNLIDAVSLQITREPYEFPKLFISKKENILSYEFTDLKLVNYKSYDAIKMEMSA